MQTAATAKASTSWQWILFVLIISSSCLTPASTSTTAQGKRKRNIKKQLIFILNSDAVCRFFPVGPSVNCHGCRNEKQQRMRRDKVQRFNRSWTLPGDGLKQPDSYLFMIILWHHTRRDGEKSEMQNK